MIFDDIVYLLLLLLSIGIGPHVRSISDTKTKQWVCTFLGLLMVVTVSGIHAIHAMLTTAVNAVIILYCSKKHCHIVSFVFTFAYLIFSRSTLSFSLPVIPPHTNAIQMILTLKLVGLAFEVHNAHLLKQDSSQGQKVVEIEYASVSPQISDIIHYAFCYAGVLIGPYYKFRTYLDMLHAPYMPHVPCLQHLKHRLRLVPLYMTLFLVSYFFFPLEYAASDEILQQPLWYRFFYMTPIFFNFRMRFYTGFVLGECVLISLGLGGYPSGCWPQPGAGPTDVAFLKELEGRPDLWPTAEYNFETVCNLIEYGSEFAVTIKEGIRSWNRTVQYWLATFIYKQLPFAKPVRMFLTMAVSSVWHGVQPGYYLCLLSAPFFLLVEAQVLSVFYRKMGPVWRRIFEWIWWIFKMQAFSYMGMAFVLLSVEATMHFWQSIYFVGHASLLVLLGAVHVSKQFSSIKVKAKT